MDRISKKNVLAKIAKVGVFCGLPLLMIGMVLMYSSHLMFGLTLGLVAVTLSGMGRDSAFHLKAMEGVEGNLRAVVDRHTKPSQAIKAVYAFSVVLRIALGLYLIYSINGAVKAGTIKVSPSELWVLVPAIGLCLFASYRFSQFKKREVLPEILRVNDELEGATVARV